MGTLIRVWTKSPLPAGAKIGRTGTVTWTVKGKKRTGKLSGKDTVSHQVDTWSAEFTDEDGKVRRVSTKTKNRSAAEQILARYEAEVARIKSGVLTREELTKAQTPRITLDDALDRFRTKMVANGNTPKSISTTLQQVLSLLHACNIDSLAKIRRETIERWLANEIRKREQNEAQAYTSRTINHYLTSVKSFVQYLVDVELLSSNPLKSMRKLNPEIGQRKKRRAMTADEFERLLQAAAERKCRTKKQSGERTLAYRLLLGTGLRSTELSLLTPNQIDFERNRLTVEAAKTKNKGADVLPVRPELVLLVKEWIELHSIQPQERIFRYNSNSIHRSFYGDLKAAGIERVGSDGRSIDVHSLRKTFGTMLAREGVPLTTVQRLMRHSTPLLTAKLYIDVDPVDMTQALEKLPMF